MWLWVKPGPQRCLGMTAPLSTAGPEQPWVCRQCAIAGTVASGQVEALRRRPSNVRLFRSARLPATDISSLSPIQYRGFQARPSHSPPLRVPYRANPRSRRYVRVWCVCVCVVYDTGFAVSQCLSVKDVLTHFDQKEHRIGPPMIPLQIK